MDFCISRRPGPPWALVADHHHLAGRILSSRMPVGVHLVVESGACLEDLHLGLMAAAW